MTGQHVPTQKPHLVHGLHQSGLALLQRLLDHHPAQQPQHVDVVLETGAEQVVEQPVSHHVVPGIQQALELLVEGVGEAENRPVVTDLAGGPKGCGPVDVVAHTSLEAPVETTHAAQPVELHI